MKDLRAKITGELYGRNTDARRACVNEDVFAFLDVGD